MKLQDLQYLPPTSLATSQTVFRVQRRRARPGNARVGPLKLPPASTLTSRFAVGTALVGYFAESPETAVYESLVRREAASLSLGSAASVRETWELSLDAVTWWPHHSSTKLGTNGRYLIRAADWPGEP